jgi:ssDNA-binding Zn-finger/Zn-ribbon topoisomerase 1
MNATAHDVICPDCGAPMVLRSTSKITYRDGKPSRFWGCSMYPRCKATHGAHPDGKPLGIPGDRQTKLARIRCHDAFDLLWKGAARMYEVVKHDGQRKRLEATARARAYAWLRSQLGMSEADCHIGRFDIPTADRAIEICAGVTPEHVRAWWKATHPEEKPSANQGGRS